MKVFHRVQKPVLLRRITGMVLSSSLLVGALSAIAQANVALNLPNLSAPGNRESGSTRSTTCIDPSDRLTAIVPESNYGLTQNGYPTFYFYLPSTNAQQVKFVLLNEATNELFYESQYSVKGDAGIVSISLPNNGIQRPLEIGQTYVWYLSIVCDAEDPSADVVVEGQVSRVDAVGTVPTTSDSRPNHFAQAGLWFDALEASAELKQGDDDTAAWNSLLEAVDLDNLVEMPFVSEGLVPPVVDRLPAE